MTGRIRFSIGALLAAATIAVVSSVGSDTATAQILWNPPCANAIIVNMTPCNLTVTLAGLPANPAPIVVPPCGGTMKLPINNGTSITGVLSQLGTLVPMTQPGWVVPAAACGGFAPLPTANADGVSQGVILPGAGGGPACCVDVYFYHGSDPAYPCHIFINTGTPPCVP